MPTGRTCDSRRSRTGRAAIAAVVAAGLAAAGCQSDDQRSRRMAEDAAALSEGSSPDQARLLREAAARGDTLGLQSVPIVERPVDTRAPQPMPDQTGPSQDVALPARADSAMRVLDVPAGLGSAFDVPAATVSAMAAERVTVDLGSGQTLIFLCRVEGAPLRLRQGDRVSVQYRSLDTPSEREQLLAVRTPGGPGVAQIVSGAESPIQLSVPSFDLVVQQVGEGRSATVRVAVGGREAVLPPGATTTVNGVMVRVVASQALAGPQSGLAEGPPYALNLLAWVR